MSTELEINLIQDALPALQLVLETRFVELLAALTPIVQASGEAQAAKLLEALQLSGGPDFVKNVKRGETAPGKFGNKQVVGYCHFSLRALIVYISDLVELVNMKAALESDELAAPFTKHLRFLSFAESILDSHKCNKTIADASNAFRPLGHWSL